MDVIAVGNANVDNLILTERFAANDEKILIKKVKKFFGGGAANFAVGISRLGLKSGFIGCIGTDENGLLFRKAIENEKVDTTFLKAHENEKTGFTIIINTLKGEHAIYAYRGANNNLRVTEEMIEYINKAKILHLVSINQTILNDIISLKDKLRVILSVDPGRLLLSNKYPKLRRILSNFDILFMNKNEFEIFLGESPSKKTILKIAKDLRLILSVQMGKEGSIISDGKNVYHTKAFSIKQVIDTTAAGDSYAVGFIFGYIGGKDLTESSLLGHATAALKIQREGALQAMPYLEELKNFLDKNKVKIEI